MSGGHVKSGVTKPPARRRRVSGLYHPATPAQFVQEKGVATVLVWSHRVRLAATALAVTAVALAGIVWLDPGTLRASGAAPPIQLRQAVVVQLTAALQAGLTSVQGISHGLWDESDLRRQALHAALSDARPKAEAVAAAAGLTVTGVRTVVEEPLDPPRSLCRGGLDGGLDGSLLVSSPWRCASPLPAMSN